MGRALTTKPIEASAHLHSSARRNLRPKLYVKSPSQSQTQVQTQTQTHSQTQTQKHARTSSSSTDLAARVRELQQYEDAKAQEVAEKAAKRARLQRESASRFAPPERYNYVPDTNDVNLYLE